LGGLAKSDEVVRCFNSLNLSNAMILQLMQGLTVSVLLLCCSVSRAFEAV